MKRQEGLALIILILGVVGLILVAYGGHWFLSKQLPKNGFTNAPQFPKQPTSSPNKTGLRIIGDKIYQGDELLFVNVKGVKAARIGPDGHTVHFKTDKSEDAKHCADLATKIYSPPSNYPYPIPPQKAPWDYQLIGSSYTIGHCGGRIQIISVI